MYRISFKKFDIEELRTEVAKLPLSYQHAHSTRTTYPKGFIHDYHEVELGYGEAIFNQAKQRISNWDFFDLPGLKIYPPKSKPTTNAISIMIYKFLMLHFPLCCRILYTIDTSSEDEKQFGFGMGTLPIHIESGEEQFLIIWNRRSDKVTYKLSSFSRPQYYWGYLLFPFIRITQLICAKRSLFYLKNKS